MSLSAELVILYGYKLENTPVTDYIDKLYEDDDVEVQCEMSDVIHNPDENNFIVCEDTMCGDYEYVGIRLYSSSSDYGVSHSVGYDMNKLKQLMDDELLDKCIQERLPWMVGKEYDVCGLMNGELPKLWIFKKVW